MHCTPLVYHNCRREQLSVCEIATALRAVLIVVHIIYIEHPNAAVACACPEDVHACASCVYIVGHDTHDILTDIVTVKQL